MRNIQFKVGDYIRIKRGHPYGDCYRISGREFGRVKAVEEEETNLRNILVEFDKNIGGHDGNGLCKNGHGWWLFDSDIIFVESYKPPSPKQYGIAIFMKQLM